ncbi:cytochrome c oxidase assembly protein subunit 15 [Rhodovulum iodosum]|uniref:Heme A synthase n=1 Tax=Rhodovulum iodosum TaxID=68291 RepID=A0ABV3XXF3_9RHOB|nr:heme A synthase [Rhodovulum robiginosum]RSK35073.1 heme A synthase [Rhodovulum robiginosum]
MSKPRSIFEEVGTEAPVEKPVVAPGAIDRAARRGARGGVRLWLVALFLLVVAMIVVGGLTRLTDSGLSITEWQPVMGAVPPLGDAGWTTAFEKYQATPEYQIQNQGMTLAEFKSIYWWEWGHRQLGRIVGLVWGLGFLAFLLLRKMPKGWTLRLFGIGFLGGVQGAIGWWMVSSGLAPGMLDVASYRLATHLGLAFLILGLIAWYVFKLARPEAELLQARRLRDGGAYGWGTALMVLAFLQIVLGALVAGIDAGRNFTDWPLMAGGLLPPEPLRLEPAWRNFFENAGTVQFTHRISGYLLFIVGLLAWRRGRKSALKSVRRGFDWMAVLLFGQLVLGVGTVLYAAQMHIALTHQLGAVALWVLILRARFLAQYPRAQSVRG